MLYLPELNTTIAVCTLEKSKRDLNAVIDERLVQILLEDGESKAGNRN